MSYPYLNSTVISQAENILLSQYLIQLEMIWWDSFLFHH